VSQEVSEVEDFVSVAPLRVDKWLWVARFYKTRALAQQAIEQGQVLLAGQTVKPSRLLHGGEILAIYARELHAKEVEVCALSRQRRSAAEAQKLYQETPSSLAQRQARAADRLLRPAVLNSRPDRRTRRLLLEQKKTLPDFDP
jgi:ribosome-associated heat shock protein Hsp15